MVWDRVKAGETRRKYIPVGSTPASLRVMVSPTFTRSPANTAVSEDWVMSLSKLMNKGFT